MGHTNERGKAWQTRASRFCADYAAAIASDSSEEFLVAKTALIEATTGRTLTADEIAYL